MRARMSGSVGGGRYGFVPARGARGRTCPRCQARPGNSCGRWNGLGIWVTIKSVHSERARQS